MVEPKVGMRVYHEGYELSGHIERFDINGAIHIRWDEPTSLHSGIFLPAKDPASAWHDRILRPTDEQPKPPEPWAPKVGDSVVMRGTVKEREVGDKFSVAFDGDAWNTRLMVPAEALHPDAASAPPQAEAKRDTLPAPKMDAEGRLLRSDHCPHCADNAGMLDAACKRLGEREVEHAAALRAVDRLAAELRDERNRRRYR